MQSELAAGSGRHLADQVGTSYQPAARPYGRMKNARDAAATAEEGISSSYVTRLLRLAFLAPDIVTAIVNGRHPPQLTANRLMDDTRLPLDWTAQRELLCS